MKQTSADRGPDDQGSILRLLWNERAQRTRGPKPALTVARIARVAVQIADAEGLAAVSMQRVAGVLGFTKPALYRYFATKAELVAVMIEAVCEPPDLDGVAGGWRPKLEEWSRLLRATWQRHPWLPGATIGHRGMGPNEMSSTECAVAALAGTGLTPREQRDAVFTLSGHLRNTQSMTTAGTQPWLTDDEDSLPMLLQRHGDRYPALIAVSQFTDDSPSDNGWQFGLRCILDGLATLIDQRSAAVLTAPNTEPEPNATGQARPTS